MVIVTSVCVLGLATLISRESNANRHAPESRPVLPELAVAEAVAYEEALQGAVADTLVAPPASEWQRVDVSRGETLSTVFDNLGLGSQQWMAILAKGGDTGRLQNLKAGDVIEMRRTGDQLEELRFAFDDTHTLQIQRNGEDFDVATLTAELDRVTKSVSGVIDSSLFVAGQDAGLPARLVMELADLFRYDIDFALDMRAGDRFTVIYEELFKDGARLRDGDMLAAEFVNQGKTYRAVRYKDEEGRSAFYTPDGESLRKAFFRTPLDVVRISSPFNLHRRHPILNTIRAHKGVDYAASAGTPVKATGNGKVEFIGTKSGYGRVIMLQHGSKYETVYAHLSRYRSGLRRGDAVSQGQVIGYVGSSGLATAPHLHYEFRVNGVHKNPVTVAVPRANPIARGQMSRFQFQVAPLLAQIDAANNAAQVAKADPRVNLTISPTAGGTLGGSLFQ